MILWNMSKSQRLTDFFPDYFQYRVDEKGEKIFKGRRAGGNHACVADCSYESKQVDPTLSDAEILDKVVFTGEGCWTKEEATKKVEKARLNEDRKSIRNL